MKKGMRAFVAGGISLLMVCCTGCGQVPSENAPELLEPVSSNSAYRPVERGKIGTPQIFLGTVTPKSYPHFFWNRVELDRIVVKVGDYVKKGDILAYVDLEEAKGQLKSLQDSLEEENTNYKKACRIVELQDKKTAYERAACDAIGDEEGVKRTDSALAVSRENARYDRILHEYRVSNMRREIEAQQEIVEVGTLVARHDGYVTYARNLSQEKLARAQENVVTVCDYDDLYIELPMNYQKYSSYKNYEQKYIKVNGTEYPVEEIEYTSEELIVAKTKDSYPIVRLACPEGVNLSIGENLPVYYKVKQQENVLLVGKDSLFREGDRNFVYVWGENSEKERREVILGNSDTHYAEVLDGLSEGELVYYQSDVKIPEDYTEMTVTASNFQVENYTNQYSNGDYTIFPYTSEYEGTISRLNVRQGDTVREGDLLYVISTGGGNAAMVEAAMNIDRAKKSYDESMKGNEAELAACDDRIRALEESKNSPEVQGNPNRIGMIDCDLELARIEKQEAVLRQKKTREEMEKSIRSMQENYERMKENNDGKGNVSVYAKHSGTVNFSSTTLDYTSMYDASKNVKVAVGDEILNITVTSSDTLMVVMRSLGDENRHNYPENLADVGERVIFTTTDKKEYTGTCIGQTMGNVGDGYVWVGTDEKGVYVSRISYSGYDFTSFYVKIDDEEFYEVDASDISKISFGYIEMSDVLVLPSELVNQETGLSGKRVDHYVWRVKDGQLIKQYVQIDDLFSTKKDMVILSGLSEGDVIAVE